METRFRRDKTVELKIQRVEVDIIPRQCDVHGVCSLEMLFLFVRFFPRCKKQTSKLQTICYFSKAHAHVRLNALSAGLSPGSKKRLEAQAKIGTHSRFVRHCQASALLTWDTSDLWYTSLICAKAKMMDLTGNRNITTAKRARKPLKKP